MLIFNPRRVFGLRGIENPQKIMVKNGFSATTASRLLNNQKAWISFEYLEKFCAMLNCTPNDLFEWKTDGRTNLTENHSLKTLQRGAATGTLREMVKDIPSEKLSRIENLLNELKNE